MTALRRWLGLTYYTSELDQFLKHRNRVDSTSVSQAQEIAKYKRIDELRDHPHDAVIKANFWVNF